MNNKSQRIPLWQQYLLTIEEAARYFRIGENKLRQLVNGDPNAEYVLWVGSRALVKRVCFEKYIDNTNAL